MKSRNTKIIAALIAVITCFSTALLVSQAASSKRIEGFSGEDTLEEMWSLGYSNDSVIDGITVYPGDEIVIPLTANMFEWKDDRNLLPKTAVRLRELRQNVRVHTYVQAGWEVLDYVQLDTDMVPGKPFYQPNSTIPTGRTATISVMFAEELVSVKDVDFKLDIYLIANGEKDEDYRITLHGTMKHEKLDINPETTYVNISDGSVAQADGSSKPPLTTEFDLGNGVTVSKLLWNNRKYYGTTAYKPSSALIPEDYPTIYPSVHGVYQLKTVNMEQGVNQVRIKPELDPERPDVKEFFVYNNEMEFIGMSSEVLPFSEQYILTYEELDSFDTGKYVEEMEELPTQIEEEEINKRDIARITPADVVD